MSPQILGLIDICITNVLIAVVDCGFREFFARAYERDREAKRLQQEERKAKVLQKQREGHRVVEVVGEGDAGAALLQGCIVRLITRVASCSF